MKQLKDQLDDAETELNSYKAQLILVLSELGLDVLKTTDGHRISVKKKEVWSPIPTMKVDIIQALAAIAPEVLTLNSRSLTSFLENGTEAETSAVAEKCRKTEIQVCRISLKT